MTSQKIPKFPVYIFDLDGTLMDSARDICSAIQEVLLACGRPVVLATLELTAQALCTPARLATLRACGTGVGLRALCDIQATVPLGRRLALRFHLLMCPNCARFRRHLRFLHDAAGRLADQAARSDGGHAGLSAEARERIERALWQQIPRTDP